MVYTKGKGGRANEKGGALTTLPLKCSQKGLVEKFRAQPNSRPKQPAGVTCSASEPVGHGVAWDDQCREGDPGEWLEAGGHRSALLATQAENCLTE